MINVLVRDVPDDVHVLLRAKAKARHQSMQEYLSVELRRLAERRTVGEILDEVEAQHGGRIGLQEAVAALDEERAAR